jgi:hypothetical protein
MDRAALAARPRVRVLLLTVLAAAAFAPGRAQEEPYYFYHGYDYGSEAVVNPVTLVLNSGFGILQYSNRSRDLFAVRYATGWKNVTYNLSHPFRAINDYGWSEFLGNEFYPKDLSRKNAQYWPNYQNHLIGGGMNYVEMAEWYRYHGVAHAKLLAAATMAIDHLLNEVVENNAFVGSNVDPLADLYFFDPMGIVLFSINGVPRFFAETLNLADWPTQPTFNPTSHTIENHGVNYSIKYRLPFAERVSIFYYWGLTGLLGVSYKTGPAENLSVGAGLRAKELVETGDQSNGRKLTADLTWNVGVFFDRNNSLLASALFSGISDYTVHVNVYPGVLRVGPVSPGLFCAVGRDGRLISGVSIAAVPVGLAARLYR